MEYPQLMSLQEKIQNDIVSAMRSKDQLRLNVLRMMKTAVKNREVEKMKPLEESEVLTVLNTLLKQRRDSVEQFRNGGREELARKEEAEIVIVEEYLPAAASEDDVQSAIAAAVAETGATSMKDMGKVMAAARALLAGKTIDGARVSQLVKERLAGSGGRAE